MAPQKLAITIRQAQTLFKAAQREKGIVDFNPTTGILTLIPEIYASARMQMETIPPDDDGADIRL